jgi:hypothetical protein
MMTSCSFRKETSLLYHAKKNNHSTEQRSSTASVVNAMNDVWCLHWLGVWVVRIRVRVFVR